MIALRLKLYDYGIIIYFRQSNFVFWYLYVLENVFSKKKKMLSKLIWCFDLNHSLLPPPKKKKEEEKPKKTNQTNNAIYVFLVCKTQCFFNFLPCNDILV